MVDFTFCILNLLYLCNFVYLYFGTLQISREIKGHCFERLHSPDGWEDILAESKHTLVKNVADIQQKIGR